MLYEVITCASGQAVGIVADAIDGRLYGGIQQLGDEHDQATSDQHEPFSYNFV